MQQKLVGIAIGLFFALGGVTMLIHMGTQYAPARLKNFLIWLMGKYPAFKEFVSSHGPDLILFVQAIEKAEEDAINAAHDDTGHTGGH